MFEYTKEILVKVSFDRNLFQKELKKAIKWLQREEKNLLRLWCISTFGNMYLDVITDTFKNVA